VVRPEGLGCACGHRGCLETVASGQGIAREAARGIRESRSPLLESLTRGQPDSVTAQDTAVAAGVGDPYAAGLLREAGLLIGMALANAVNLLNPALVVLGGGLTDAGKGFLGAIDESLKR
jgi:glucokinase